MLERKERKPQQQKLMCANYTTTVGSRRYQGEKVCDRNRNNNNKF